MMKTRRRTEDLSRQDLETVLAVTRALAAPFDLGSMLAAVTDAARQTLRAERASVWLLDAAHDELVLEIAADIGSVRIPVGQGLVGASARERTTINVPDCYADPRFDRAVDRRSGFHTRCSVTVPLIDHTGALIGVMQVLNKQGGVFVDNDLGLAEALAAQCAMALSRVRMTAALLDGERLRQELELARVVQLGTLPASLPQLPGYEMHATFLPAEQTGGDTYDAVLGPGGLALVLGDAAGHGIAPALAVTQMQAMLRMALRLGSDLESAFRHVNDQLADSAADGRFVTAFVGLLDPATHHLRYLSGGQAPILLYRAADGACERHRSTSFPMGAMPIAKLRPPVELDLLPGDLLALATDGVFEAEDDRAQAFGVDRVEVLLHQGRGLPLETLAQQLLSALAAHRGAAPQADDITMLLLRRSAA
ncbi:MAG: GAF domain-containing SpoIIE family protein phosphatase [Rubrivivax sp.]